jgi:hypothetical protein
MVYLRGVLSGTLEELPQVQAAPSCLVAVAAVGM